MEQTSRSRHERFLVVRLAGQEFAVPANRVCGMLQMRGLDARPVENEGSLRYLAEVHGKSIPVLVPHARLGLKERPVSARSCVLLIRAEEEPHEARCGLMVDSISRMEDISQAQQRPSGQIRLGDKWREVLNLDALCAA